MVPRHLRASAAVLAGGVVPFLLARVAAARSVLPAIGVVRGPLGVVLLVLAGGVALGKAVPLRWPRPRAGAALFAASLSLYLLVGLPYTSRLQVSGDEPYYLLMAQSLWREHDLDLQDNFARESLLAALLGLEVRRMAWRLTGDRAAAFLAWAAAAGPPVCFYAFHLYTEVPSALCLAAGLNLLLGAPGVAGAGLAALLASFLPWLHVKMIPAAAALGVVALGRLRGPARAVFVVVAGTMALGDLAYYRHVFGQSTPLALYGGVVPEAARSSPVSAVLGFLLDRSFGLLPHAPVFLIAALGLVLLGARARQDAWPHLLVGLGVLAPLLTWRMWWGGQCPPGRFLVPLVPVLAAALALRAAQPVRGLARWRGPLLALGVALAGFMAADPGGLMLLNRGNRPTRVWAELSGETPIGRYLPALTLPAAAEWRVALLWVLALGTLVALDRLARDHDRIDEWFRGLVLPVLLLLAVGAGVDAWARPPAPLGGSGAPEDQLLSLSCQRSFSRIA